MRAFELDEPPEETIVRGVGDLRGVEDVVLMVVVVDLGAKRLDLACRRGRRRLSGHASLYTVRRAGAANRAGRRRIRLDLPGPLPESSKGSARVSLRHG